MLNIILLSVVIWMESSAIAGDEKCPDEYLRFSDTHSFCQPPNPQCKIEKTSVSKEDIQVILKEHNKYRSDLATGKIEKFPSASNMLEMVWDDELAAVAQKYATQCTFEHDCLNCRRVPNFSVGQNLGIEWTNQPPFESPKSNWTGKVKNWFNEIKFFPTNAIEPFRYKKEYGHFTQVVWADTWRIGCGYVLYKEPSKESKLYVCNYGPVGNVKSKSMYKKGKECSACPENASCSSKYPGLCKITDNKAPVYKKPKNAKYIYYCDFKDMSKCKVKGDNFQQKITLSRSYISTTLKGGEKTTISFDTGLKATGSDLCLTVYYRVTPRKYGEEDGGIMTLILELQGSSPITEDLPNYPEPYRQQFTSFEYEIGTKKEIRLTLKFSVPNGKPDQIFEVSEVYAYDGECEY